MQKDQTSEIHSKKSQKKKHASSQEQETSRNYRKRFAGGAGSETMIGEEETNVADMVRMADAGFAGTTVSFVNYKDELPYFIKTVLPLMREAGLRSA